MRRKTISILGVMYVLLLPSARYADVNNSLLFSVHPGDIHGSHIFSNGNDVSVKTRGRCITHLAKMSIGP